MEKMHDSALNAGAWQLRATAWEFMALSLRYPDMVLVEAIGSGEWLDAAWEIAGAFRLELPEDFGERMVGCKVAAVELAGESNGLAALDSKMDSDPETLLHTLRLEATRLFIGAPEPVVSPYEGIHRAQTDGVQALLFVNPHSMEVERFVQACGLGRPGGTNEPLDHLATECELLEHLALRAAGITLEDGVAATDLPGGSAEAAYNTFLEEHARIWMPGFADAVATETREPFYRAAAQMLAVLEA